ncbi:MAG: MBL fold metallo-hydrolase [Crenarchaeota archaeon]|nr:MBL fold metallo-hydrolase [Thermoproteota archaeon]
MKHVLAILVILSIIIAAVMIAVYISYRELSIEQTSSSFSTTPTHISKNQNTETHISVTEKTAGNIASVNGSGNVTIIVVVDNDPDPSGRLESSWGLSILVETGTEKILFDTGPSPSILQHNLRTIGVSPEEIDAVVISHLHGDHTSGLLYILENNPGIPVYLPGPDARCILSEIKSYGGRPILVNSMVEVARGIYVLKPLYGPPWEEALVIMSDKGPVLLVGCSHPGIVRLVEEEINFTGKPPILVIGGFHLIGCSFSECERIANRLVSFGVGLIAPIHCSGDIIKHILSQEYPEHYLYAHTGSTIRI